MYHPLMAVDSALRLSALPQLLQVTETIHGPDFTRFTETLTRGLLAPGPAVRRGAGDGAAGDAPFATAIDGVFREVMVT